MSHVRRGQRGHLGGFGIVNAETAKTAKLGDDPAIAMPSFRSIVARTGITPAALHRMQEASSHSVSRVAATTDVTLSAVGTPTYAYWTGGLRGIYLDADTDAFSANVFDPGVASILYAGIISPITVDLDRYIFGRYEVGGKQLRLRLYLDNTVYVHIGDGVTGEQVTLVSSTPLVAGGIYLLILQLDRAANVIRVRISRLGVGPIGAVTTASVAIYGTLTGGTTPLFSLGSIIGGASLVGGGIWHGGLISATGAQIEGAGVPAALAGALGFE